MPPTISREELVETVRRLAAEQVCLDPATVSLDADFFNDLGYDSLDSVEFTMNLEEAFDLSIPDERGESVRTPRQAIELLMPLVCMAEAPH